MFLNAATILCLHGKIGNANTENAIRKDGVFCDRIGTPIMLSLRGFEEAVAIRTPCRQFYSAAQSQVRVRKMAACRETDCHVAALLAMTEEIEAQAQTNDHICHCEAPKGPHPRVASLAPAGQFTFWQSQGSFVQLKFLVRRCPEIATGLTALAMTRLEERIATSLRLLAMTGEIEAQAQTIDHICHCEAP